MRTRDHIMGLAALGFALGITPAFAFDSPRPGAGAADVLEYNPPRPPASVPRAMVAPAGIPNPGAGLLPVPRPAPPPATAAIPALVAPPPPLGRPEAPPIEATTAPAFAAPTMPITPFEAFRSGTHMLRQGDKAKALVSLEYAAEQGFIMAQWKLARMYAEGDGVAQSDLRAFDYYSRIADAHADDLPGTQQARFVANAFVALGHYYGEGIPNSDVKADIARARHMYFHAATYFGDPEAQYYYGRMLLDGTGGGKDPRRAAQWFNSAANKGQYKAQAMLGRMLFMGETGVPRQAARGLMWLALASSNAPAADHWIPDLYDAAYKQANQDERALAGEFLVQWMNGRRD